MQEALVIVQAPDPTFSVSEPSAERYPERQCSTWAVIYHGIQWPIGGCDMHDTKVS